MKTLLTHLSIVLIILSGHAYAHDPSEHNEKKENPKCEKMKSMDHSKMTSDDPVMQAMMKKCMKEMESMHHDENQSEAGPEEEPGEDKAEDEHADHQH